MVILEVKMQGSIVIPPDQLVWAVILRLMGISTTRKSSNEYGFFVAVTFLSKIGEGRIWDLTGDVIFHVAFKGAIPTVTMKNPRHCWCVMSNKALTGSSNRTEPSSPMDRSSDFQSARQSNKQGRSKYSPMNQARP